MVANAAFGSVVRGMLPALFRMARARARLASWFVVSVEIAHALFSIWNATGKATVGGMSATYVGVMKWPGNLLQLFRFEPPYNCVAAMAVRAHAMVEVCMTADSHLQPLQTDILVTSSFSMDQSFRFIREGLSAGQNGKPLSANPHEPETARWHRWRAGWFASDAIIPSEHSRAVFAGCLAGGVPA
jgi:hypothetical protein